MSAGRSKFIEGDTLMDGHYYRFQYGYSMLGEPGPGGNICPPFIVDTVPHKFAIIREDTLERKVYIYDENSTPHDQLLYDFSLEIGDTLFSSYLGLGALLVLDTIENVMLLNGEIRKKFTFDCNNQGECFYVEGIGGCYGLLNPIVMGLGFGWDLFCVKENDDPLWSYECDYYFVGIEDYCSLMIRISPNPVTSILTVSVTPRSGQISILLIDLVGRLKSVSHFTPNQDKALINVSTMKPGIYLLKIADGEMVIGVEKVVVVR